MPSIDNHLVPPFIMREAGIAVNNTPKIHTYDSSVTDHCLHFKNYLKITMSLHGIFSYFLMTKPTLEMLQECEDIFLLTPSTWDSHNTAFSNNEEKMLNWQRNMIEANHHKKICFEGIEENINIYAAVFVDHVECNAIEEIF